MSTNAGLLAYTVLSALLLPTADLSNPRPSTATATETKATTSSSFDMMPSSRQFLDPQCNTVRVPINVDLLSRTLYSTNFLSLNCESLLDLPADQYCKGPVRPDFSSLASAQPGPSPARALKFEARGPNKIR